MIATEAMWVAAGIMAIVLIYVAAWRHLLGGRLLITAPAAFLLYQLPNAIGTVLNANVLSNFDVFWVVLRVAGLAAFVIGGTAANTRLRYSPRKETDEFRQRAIVDDLNGSVSPVALGFAAIVSILVGGYFAAGVGYNTFANSVRSVFTGGSVDAANFSAERANATLGSYSAAGYVVQFTAFILPSIIVMVAVRARLKKRPALMLLAFGMACIDLYFVTVVGGRKYLIGTLAMAALLYFSSTSPLPPGLRAKRLGSYLLMALTVAAFGITTFLQGRANSDPSESLLRLSIVGLWNRLGGTYSYYQFESIRLLRGDPFAWGGQWWEQLKIALPGASNGPSFDQRVYALLYHGNTRGNAPLDFWGTTYYNWSAVGVIVLAFLLGYAFQVFSVKHLIRPRKTLSRVVLISWAGYRLALWRDPYSMLLEGAITLIGLFLIHRSLRTGRHREAVGTRASANNPRTAASAKASSPRFSARRS